MELMKPLLETSQRFFRSLDTEPTSGLLHALKRRSGYGLLNRFIAHAVPFTSRNGFQIVATGPGYVKASICLKGNTNHFGTMYAGAMFVLAEIPGGVLSLLEFGTDYVPILRELQMTYLRTARSDVTVEFRLPPEDVNVILGEIEQRGKAHFELAGELRDATGELIARSFARYQVRSKGWHCGAD